MGSMFSSKYESNTAAVLCTLFVPGDVGRYAKMAPNRCGDPWMKGGQTMKKVLLGATFAATAARGRVCRPGERCDWRRGHEKAH
jgi:hypothetical protein